LPINLYDHQREALKNMHNGCILCGGVGSGKSRTALAYYHCVVGGGRIRPKFELMTHPIDLYIITTARKRDTFEWEKECIPFLLYSATSEGKKQKEADSGGKEPYVDLKVVIDSWNNIHKYSDIEGAFFIFDEQRVVGNGAWVKAFLKITKKNQWILLSATPGDTWTDYIPVFVANGFYKNRSEFNREHVSFKRMGTYWKVDRYFNTKRLERLRERVLVDMDFERPTTAHHIDINCEWDKNIYKQIMKKRWDPWKDEPLDNASSLCYCLRKSVNKDVSRLYELLDILDEHPKAIIFYNFDYELKVIKETLTDIAYGFEVAEWNGHKHQEIPSGEKWCFLVQYNLCEGWNCIKTDTIIFYSQNYSYKTMKQAEGRIDRLNTPFKDLYYYHLKSKAPIDIAIGRAIAEKKTFNEGRYFNRIMKGEGK